MSQNLAERRRDELAALIATNNGTITPAQVVDFAANPETALHALFTWDDDAAAQSWREAQAAKYLRAVVRLIPNGHGAPVTVRAFVSLSTDRRDSNVYRPIESVLADDDQRAVLLADAKSGLVALRKKYGHLEELSQVWEAIPLALKAA